MEKTRQPLSNLRKGDEDQFWRKLHERGVTADDIEWSVRDDSATEVVASLLTKQHLLSSPREQIERFLKLNENVWKDRSVTMGAITDLGEPPLSPAPSREGLFATVLLRETGDPIRTFRENWKALQSVHGESGAVAEKGLILDKLHVGVRQGAKQRQKGLRWTVVELGHRYRSHNFRHMVESIDGKSRMAVGQELPLIAALHWGWARAKKDKRLPSLIALDLEFKIPSEGSEPQVPHLSTDRSFDVVTLGVISTSPRLAINVAVASHGAGWFYR